MPTYNFDTTIKGGLKVEVDVAVYGGEETDITAYFHTGHIVKFPLPDEDIERISEEAFEMHSEALHTAQELRSDQEQGR